MRTASSHISYVLRWSGISFIQRGVLSCRAMFFMSLDQGEGQILRTKKMIEGNLLKSLLS